MGIKYTDSDAVVHDFEQEAGAGGTTRPVHGLAASIVAIFTSIKTATEAVAALIAAGRLATSNSALEALISSGKYLVSDATAQGKLDTIIASLGLPSGGPKFGQKGSIGSSDAQFDSQALTRGMVVMNISTSEILYISHAATVSATTSYHLFPGQTTPLIECSNANAIFMRASTGSSGKACYAGA